jgi:hypothetical protein
MDAATVGLPTGCPGVQVDWGKSERGREARAILPGRNEKMTIFRLD